MNLSLAVIVRLVCVALVCLLGWARDCAAEMNWTRLGDLATGQRSGSVLLSIPDQKMMLLFGQAKDAPFMQSMEGAAGEWREFSKTSTQVKRFEPYYQSAYDAGSKSVYCLSGGNVLYRFDVGEKTWTALPAAHELDGLSWQTLACDATARKLVIVGADKSAAGLGWMRTVVYDIPSGKWTTLRVSDENVIARHREIEALESSVRGLVGKIRLVWFRDPQGKATDEERGALIEECRAIGATAQAKNYADDLKSVISLLGEGKALEALKTAREVHRKVEDAVAAQYPVPRSRRNSPLAFDSASGLFVLFGGDHEDYLMNDTWVLDVKAESWKHMKCDLAPSPRAGHALISLPKAGGVLLYEGYVQSNSTDYGASPASTIKPLEMWHFEVKQNRWNLLGNWPLPAKGDKTGLGATGHFYGYASEYYSPPAVAVDEDDRIILVTQNGRDSSNPAPAGTWAIAVDTAQSDVQGREKLGRAPDQRLYRTGPFVASFCEVPDAPKPTNLDALPDNRWVKLADAPRDPCKGCRQRDWGTAAWDSDRDEILLWGGGHKVRSSSSVVHWSPASGRIVESYDADEPYGGNGGGGFDSSLLNRPWVSVHNYHHYAYDPKCKLMVSARGYLYDPAVMDWLRMEPMTTPFVFEWSHTVVQTSTRGAIAWAKKKGSENYGLWQFDREKEWVDLEPKGKLFEPYCDAHGMVYDAKRDRMILGGVGGGYEKRANGTLIAFDFKTRKLDAITPENANLLQTRNSREMAYIEYADWIITGELFRVGEKKDDEKETRKPFTRIYDCGQNRAYLLDAGEVPDGHSTGWMYDARRKLVYVFTYRGEAWAMKVEPKTAKLLDAPP